MKKEFVKKLVNAYADILGICVPGIVYYDKKIDKGLLSLSMLKCVKEDAIASFIVEDNTIFINLENINVNAIPIILAHEMYHCYEFFCINNRDKVISIENEELIDIWEYNSKHYNNNISVVEYDLQPLELYAVMFSNQIAFYYYNTFISGLMDMMASDEDLCVDAATIIIDKYPKELFQKWFDYYDITFTKTG